MCTANIAIIYAIEEQFEQAKYYFMESYTVIREIGDRHQALNSLSNLALLNISQGDYEQASACLEEALPEARLLGNVILLAFVLGNIALNYFYLEDDENCYRYLHETITLCHKHDSQPRLLDMLLTFACLQLRQGHIVDSARLTGFIKEQPALIAFTRETYLDPHITALADLLDKTSLEKAFAAGKALAFDDIAQEVLAAISEKLSA